MCPRTTLEQLEVAGLVRETRPRLELSQEKFATLLGVSFHSVNRWENKQTCPLPLGWKQIETLLQS
ncbi:helix-turn-helix domain-containing protein [Coleofasciculus sp. FACHB-542]|nr:helix-turn-helix domain-containing protein [Coleofasciculus sp. FACHB-542]MBD2086881.1 helix-turn-helix domain-containing protein [Coleofasciculus sp. FACHB-542]